MSSGEKYYNITATKASQAKTKRIFYLNLSGVIINSKTEDRKVKRHFEKGSHQPE